MKTMVCISIIFIGMTFTCSSFAKVGAESIVGMWLFDEERGNVAEDYSENGNDGEIKGDPETVEGRFGEAISCNPSDHIAIPDSESLDVTGELTVMAWANVNAYHSGQIVMKSTALAADKTIYGFQVWDDRQFYCHIITDTGWLEINAGEYPLDEWFHLAMTYDGSMLKWYMDGELLIESAKSGDITTNDDPFMIGGGHNFNGSIDEVAVFSKALSEDDIKAIATEGLNEALSLSAVSFKGKLAAKWGSVKQKY